MDVFIRCIGSMSLLNMTHPLFHVDLGKSYIHHFSSMGLGNLFSSHPITNFINMTSDSIWVKYFQPPESCHWYVQENFASVVFNLPLILCFVLIHYHHVPLSRVDDVGNIMALLRPSHFLSTSAHYPGSWPRDSLPVPWSLHATMASSSHSMTGPHHWPSI